MPTISIFEWAYYTTSLTNTELETSTHGNDPAQTGSNPYNPAEVTWTGVDFTFNGGAASVIDINDDDGFFQDAYVETGGAQTLNAPITIGPNSFNAGDAVELEFSLLDSGGNEVYVVRIDGINVGFAYLHGNQPGVGEVFNANDTRDGDGLDSLDQTTPSEEAYGNILCFTAGTAIETDVGPRAVETLRPGDMIATLDAGLQPVRLVTCTDYKWPAHMARCKPILFRCGSLGAGLPRRDLVVSAQHRMLVPDDAGRFCLAPARAMEVLRGVRHMRGLRRATLIHLLFDRHQIIFAEGAPTESFYPGKLAIGALDSIQRRDVLDIVGATPQVYAPARPFLATSDCEEVLFDRMACWTAEQAQTLPCHVGRKMPEGAVSLA